jgi:nitrite reductase/ring-hydroxylating ferredoxin subunit
VEVRVAALADLVAGQPVLVEVEGRRLVLARLGGAVHACGAVCSHRGGSLAEGRLSGHRLACPLHGWIYDVRSGQCLFPPRGTGVPSYAVRVAGGDVYVTIEEG